jgi:YggT family protein
MNQFLLFVIKFIDVISMILNLLIFARIIMSWMSMGKVLSLGKAGSIVYEITEPIFKFFRKFPLRVGMFDLTPMIAILAIDFTSALLINILSSFLI